MLKLKRASGRKKAEPTLLEKGAVPSHEKMADARRPARPLRAAAVVLALALVGALAAHWERLKQVGQDEPVESLELDVEYCPRLALDAASGARLADMLADPRWKSLRFIANAPGGAQPVTVEETRMLTVLGETGVRWLSFGLVRLQALQLSLRYVGPAEAEAVARNATNCPKPTPLDAARFLMGAAVREGFATIGGATLHLGVGSATRSSVRDIYAYLGLHLLLGLAGTLFCLSLVDDRALALYRKVARDLLPPGSEADAVPAWDQAGPVFLADNLAGTGRNEGHAADMFAALRILLAILLPTYLVVPMVAFAPSALVAGGLACALCAYLAIAALHSALYLLAVPFRARAWVAYPFLLCWSLCVLLAAFGSTSWLLWMVVFLGLDPVSVAAGLIAVISSVGYVYAQLSTIRAMLEADEVPLAFKRFGAGLSKQDLLVNVCAFTGLTLFGALVVIWGWILLTPRGARDPQDIGSLVMVGVVPVAEYLSSARVKAYAQSGSRQVEADYAAA